MFQLTDYLAEIKAIAAKSGCTKTAAVDRMIVNLNTFNPHNPGTGNVNYHIVGHQWGALTAAEKNAQKAEAKRRVMTEDAATEHRSRRR